MLVISRRENESFMIGDDIRIIIGERLGNQTRIMIDAPKDIKILRKELYDIERASSSQPES